MKTAVIYARVSSAGAVESRQSTERQVIDLTDYAAKNSMTICKTFEEHISGAKKNHERPVLQECLTYCIDEQIDVLLLSELSRLGRNVDEVLANIRFAKENHLNIYFQKEGISIYGADSKGTVVMKHVAQHGTGLLTQVRICRNPFRHKEIVII
mgnify:CR=1 FL=1